jgi:hypothetical protein
VTPATAISRLDAAIAGYGQSVTLQRTSVDVATGAVTVAQEVTCAAAVRVFGPQDLQAGEAPDIRVILSPTGLGSFDPLRDDNVVIDGNPTKVQQIESLKYGGQLVRVNLLCRG